MCVIVKTRCFYTLPLIHNQNWKIQPTTLETFTKKNSLQNLTSFHGGLFELEILEIFTAFLSITIIRTLFFQVLQRALLKNEKKNLKKDASHLEIVWHCKRQKKNIEKRERKTKNEKKSNNNNKYFFTYTFLCRKIYMLLENISGKTCFILLHLYYSFFTWQFIENAAVKHQLPYKYVLIL